MKQITNEERAKVFALYYGSSRGTCYFNETNYNNDRPVDAVFIERVLSGKYECHLILKPLSAISDKDAIEVATKFYFNTYQNPYPITDWVVDTRGGCTEVKSQDQRFSLLIYHNPNGDYNSPFLWWVHGSNMSTVSVNGALFITDFLRSKSYALPYLGIDLFESKIAIPA